MSQKFNQLTLDSKIDEIPLNNYPRPSLKRDSFICLNGKWDDGVTVPFPLESVNSGFKGQIPTEYTYFRTINIPKDFFKDYVLLHFGAVDESCEVSIDDKIVGSHEGGYLPFEFDITEFIKPGHNHTLSVKVTDTLSHLEPYGKQKKNRGGMWYTPVTGIWQSVWLESVSKDYIKSLEITPYLDKISVNIESEAGNFHVEISQKNKTVFTGDFDSPYFSINIENPLLWTPECPNLYDIKITTAGDEISSYFGLRTLTEGRVNGIPRILLNGKPYFFNGVLDQGYFPEGIFTPNTESDYERDILNLKELGINTIRKHIKIEPECFYEACDRLGMIVFQDMVNNGSYKFMRDTALPTIGIKDLNDRKFRVKDEVKYIFEHHMEETLAHLYNFPCICYYTIFNEGWGQFDSDVMYQIATAMDPTRIIDTTSGWFHQDLSDVDSYHIYFKPLKLNFGNAPVIVSEFGGFALKLPEHSYNVKKTYGYGKMKTTEELTKRLEDLYRDEVIPAIEKGLCGTIYTQATDVEDETNGFYTYDRKVCKVDKERIKALFEGLHI